MRNNAKRNAEISALYSEGMVTIQKLAWAYELSEASIKMILKKSGVLEDIADDWESRAAQWRAKRALQLCAAGNSTQAVAERLGMLQNTVSTMCRRAGIVRVNDPEYFMEVSPDWI